jgi:hypothetical protein
VKEANRPAAGGERRAAVYAEKVLYEYSRQIASTGLQFFYVKGPHPLLWAGSPVACTEVTISGVSLCLNCCVNFVVYTRFKNVGLRL